MLPVRPEPSVKPYDNRPFVQVEKLSVALPTATPFVVGGALKFPPTFSQIVSAALGWPLTT
jgi:hypothetical protein